MFSLIAALIAPLRNAFADRGDLLLENAALRQQLGVYRRNGNRPLLTSADRRFWVWLSRCWPRWRTALVMVQPEPVIRWRREAEAAGDDALALQQLQVVAADVNGKTVTDRTASCIPPSQRQCGGSLHG